MILLTTLCWFAAFELVVFFHTPLNLKQLFEHAFSVDIRYFLWSSIFYSRFILPHLRIYGFLAKIVQQIATL